MTELPLIPPAPLTVFPSTLETGGYVEPTTTILPGVNLNWPPETIKGEPESAALTLDPQVFPAAPGAEPSGRATRYLVFEYHNHVDEALVASGWEKRGEMTFTGSYQRALAEFFDLEGTEPTEGNLYAIVPASAFHILEPRPPVRQRFTFEEPTS